MARHFVQLTLKPSDFWKVKTVSHGWSLSGWCTSALEHGIQNLDIVSRDYFGPAHIDRGTPKSSQTVSVPEDIGDVLDRTLAAYGWQRSMFVRACVLYKLNTSTEVKPFVHLRETGYDDEAFTLECRLAGELACELLAHLMTGSETDTIRPIDSAMADDLRFKIVRSLDKRHVPRSVMMRDPTICLAMAKLVAALRMEGCELELFGALRDRARARAFKQDQEPVEAASRESSDV